MVLTSLVGTETKAYFSQRFDKAYQEKSQRKSTLRPTRLLKCLCRNDVDLLDDRMAFYKEDAKDS